MSIGHLDHVLTVYSSMEHVTWILGRQAGSLVWGSRSTRKKTFTAGTQTRACRARESSVTHKSAITDYTVEENHVIDWDKAKVVDREAQRQTRWIKEALWIRKTQTYSMNQDAGSYQLSHTWDQVISRSRAVRTWSRCPTDIETSSLGNIFQLCKGKGLDTCYSTTYMSQTRDQQPFTISEVADDWHEPMVPQRIMWPSIACANGQLVPQCS